MADWFRVVGLVVTATVATAVVINVLFAEYRRRERQHHENENRGSGRNGNNYSQARDNQNHTSSQNSNSRARELSQERRRRLMELRESRIREREEEMKREREEEERKKTEKMKSMLDNFDDVFDAEIGETTERGYVEEDFDDLSRHVQKRRSKREFRSKQLAQHQESQDQER